MKYLRFTALLLAAALLVFLCGCSLLGGKEESAPEAEEPGEEELDPEYPVTAAGATLTVRPARVVSLAPAITEKLYDLDMDDHLVGVSTYCNYPDTVLSLPDCGTAQVPDLEEIESLEPHLVLTVGALSDEAAAYLDELGIPVATFSHAGSVDALMNTYLDLARLMEGEASGALIGQIFTESYLARLQELKSVLRPHTEENGRKKVLYLRLLDPANTGDDAFFTVATGDTFEQELLDYACLDNIAQSQAGWQYPESLAKGDGQADFVSLDVIYMDDAFVTIGMLEESAFFKGLPAVLQDRYQYISSIALERQSMRTLFMLEDMAAHAYPDASLQTTPATMNADDDNDGYENLPQDDEAPDTDE